jgi:hypothetical protein
MTNLLFRSCETQAGGILCTSSSGVNPTAEQCPDCITTYAGGLRPLRRKSRHRYVRMTPMTLSIDSTIDDVR